MILHLVPQIYNPYDVNVSLIEDKYNSHGLLVERVEYQKIPTIETERLYCFNEEQRIPKLENAFLIESI
ncbi:DUF6012 family protein [Vibrio gangliei]|uniref:DUF6012 family protein n=1 Tax=Vibrio gangliei TaxID=2077090 RepID=UPI000D02009B|nr:DUF6012 family protein [Vibrio gangliei]